MRSSAFLGHDSQSFQVADAHLSSDSLHWHLRQHMAEDELVSISSAQQLPKPQVLFRQTVCTHKLHPPVPETRSPPPVQPSRLYFFDAAMSAGAVTGSAGPPLAPRMRIRLGHGQTKWVWLKIKQGGQTAGLVPMFPLTRATHFWNSVFF